MNAASISTPQPWITPPHALLLLSAAAITAMVSVALPLMTYTLSLALFGLAHVLSELRYVDERFGPRIGRHLRLVLGALLTGVVGLRLARLFEWAPPTVAQTAEVALVLLLSLSVLPMLARHSGARLLIGAAVSGALLIGLLLSPIHTLLIMAILHNITPLGFIAEALSGQKRRLALTVAGALFVGVPLIIATGLPFQTLAALGMVAPEASILPTGPLAAHFKAYLPTSVHMETWAIHAFSAVVFAQCMHYAVVIHLLPRLLPQTPRPSGSLPWPSNTLWTALLVILGALLFGVFVWSFNDARAIYGIAAAVHAWVEIPVLMLALVMWAGSSPPRRDLA